MSERPTPKRERAKKERVEEEGERRKKLHTVDDFKCFTGCSMITNCPPVYTNHK